jgi:hypothetical protein
MFMSTWVPSILRNIFPRHVIFVPKVEDTIKYYKSYNPLAVDRWWQNWGDMNIK